MIKRIPVDRLQVGMYIYDLDCGWMAHPFLVNRFAVKDSATIAKIAAAGIREVYIDTRRGSDVQDAPTLSEVREEATRDMHDIIVDRPSLPATAALADESYRARKLYDKANKLVCELIRDSQRGRRVDVGKCEPVAEGVVDSIFRHPDALLPLAHLRTSSEYTSRHGIAVAALATAFGRSLELPRPAIRDLALSGLLHDIGTAKVPDAVLNKAGKLTDAELAMMKSHVAQGAAMLADALPKASDEVLTAVREHHERFDGSGYPNGIKGRGISLYGQILGIADVYDAITSPRAYRAGIPHTEALARLLEWSKHHFDQSLVHAFVKCIGVYPVGTLVRLESNRLGVVRESNGDDMLRPKVYVMYHATKQHYLLPTMVDLADSADRIAAHESYERWGIDRSRWL